MKLFVFAALAALALQGQSAAPATKPESSLKTPGASAPVAPVIPLDTARLWRLLAETQSLRQQLDATEQGKALKEAQAQLEAEQADLSGKCATVGKVLGYEQDKASPRYKDIVCVAKPPDQAVAKPEPPKGK